MKFISKYNEYLFVKNLEDFEFIIYFDTFRHKEDEKFIEETNKYFDVNEHWLRKYIENNMYLKFSFHQSLGNAFQPRLSVTISPIIVHDEEKRNAIAINDFLSVGYEGIREYIEMKNNINKYNL